MIKFLFTRVSIVLAASILSLGLVTGIATANAQGTSATPSEAVAPYPAHIHSGSCAELGDVVYPLNPLTRVSADVPPGGTPVAAIPTAEVETAATPTMTNETTVVAASSTIVDAALDDILAEEHAINVHESPENIQNYIACGDLAGAATGGELRIELQELHNSGYTGEAHLQDNGDGTTTVTVTLMFAGTDATGALEASPES